jgi:hypothetical protein
LSHPVSPKWSVTEKYGEDEKIFILGVCYYMYVFQVQANLFPGYFFQQKIIGIVRTVGA